MLPGMAPVVVRTAALDPVASIFGDGTDGFYSDYSKTGRLFTTVADAANSAQPLMVGAANDPIGAAFEGHAWGAGHTSVSDRAAASPQLVTNGDLSNGTTGWTARRGATLSVSGGELVVTGTGTAAPSASQLLVVASKPTAVEVKVTVGQGTSSRNRLAIGSAVDLASNEIGRLIDVANNASYTFYVIVPAGNVYLHLSPQNTTGVGKFSAISVREVPGYHGQQASAAARPKWQPGGLARFDGADDQLQSTLALGSTAFTLMAKVRLEVTTGTGTVLLGSKDASAGRAAIRLTGGVLGGDVGSQDPNVIKGGGDVRGTTFVAALVATGTAVTLIKNNETLYTGPQVGGGASSARAIYLGILNNDGAVGGDFMAGDMMYALAIKKALTPTEIAAITNHWGTS